MTNTNLTLPPGLWATIGLPGSGKTTWAMLRINHSPDTVARANRDELRKAQSGKRRGTPAQEKAVSIAQDALIRANFAAGFTTVIVDDTNLRGVSRLKRLAADLGVDFHVHDLRTVPRSTCILRDSLREGDEQVGAEVITRMHDEHVLPYLRSTARRQARTDVPA